MAIPFYYNPATNELELTADPSPLRDSLGTRFGLNEISTARKTLSPTKSYTEGGRTGFDAGTLVAEEVSVKPSKLKDVAKKYVGTPVTKVIAGATLPGWHIPETVKAIKEKRLPDYDLTDPNTWMHAAFWNWAVKEWGVTKTLDQFSKANIPGKAKILSHVVARGGLSPNLVKFISSKVAWPATAAASVYDAYKDYQRRKPFIKEQKELIKQGVVKEETFDKTLPMLAKGGKIGDRVGLKDGKGIISQTGIPYYADKALEGIVHSAETLSKLPFAGGKLISDLLRQKPTKKMFTEALEEIQPGSWSSKIGLNDLIAKEEKNLPQSIKNVGNVLGLGTEIAVPVGAAFTVGNTILKNVSKSFGKSKKGKNLEQVVDKQLTAFGQSRRDFNIVAGTSGLMVALKAIGLGGLATKAAKLGDDIKVTLKSDADYSYEGPESGWEGGTWTNVSFEPLTKVGIKILDSLVKSKQMIKDKVGGYISNTSEDAVIAVEKIKNKNGKMQVETTVGEKTKGAVKGKYESTKIYSGKDIDSKTILKESADDLVTDPIYADPVFTDEFTEEIINIISPKKVTKAEGGIADLLEGNNV